MPCDLGFVRNVAGQRIHSRQCSNRHKWVRLSAQTRDIEGALADGIWQGGQLGLVVLKAL